MLTNGSGAPGIVLTDGAVKSYSQGPFVGIPSLFVPLILCRTVLYFIFRFCLAIETCSFALQGVFSCLMIFLSRIRVHCNDARRALAVEFNHDQKNSVGCLVGLLA